MNILIDNKNKTKLIIDIILERINKIKKQKNKYLKKYMNKNLKTNDSNLSSIEFTGLKFGDKIKWEDIEPPLDKPIQLNFKIDLDLDNVFYSKYPLFLLNNNEISNKKIEILINEINDYIKKVSELKPNIYDYYKIIKVSQNEINYFNKKKITIWNLQIKKEFCICWDFMTKLFLEFTYVFNNKTNEITNEITNDTINEITNEIFTKLEETNLNEFDKYSMTRSNLSDILYFLYNIKKLFDYLDINGYLLSINEIDYIADKLKFILIYVKNNI